MSRQANGFDGVHTRPQLRRDRSQSGGRTGDDVVWDAVLDRLDLDGAELDASELEAAEARLALAEDERLPQDAIARMVAEAVAPPAAPQPAAPRLRVRKRRLAAGFFGAVLLVAATKGFLIWAEGRYSSQTLPLDKVVALLEAGNQPREDTRSAISKAYHTVKEVVDTLRAIRAESDQQVQSLVTAAERHLENLRQIMTGASAAGSVGSDFINAVVEARNRALDPGQRMVALEHATATAATVLASLRAAKLPPDEDSDRRTLLTRLQQLLAKD
jgi:hypothetical protein